MASVVAADDATARILLVELGTRVAGVVVEEVHDIGVLDKDLPIADAPKQFDSPTGMSARRRIADSSVSTSLRNNDA